MQPILSVDLSTGAAHSIAVPQKWADRYLGGASLAARILYESLTPELEPLSPEAPLLFLTGPLTGTAGPAVGRFVVAGRSPATGLWAESNCGGFWGPELRKAGYDGLLVTGKADTPVYLWIQDRELFIRSAVHLWGLETYQTQDSLVRELDIPGVRVATIGPAGEKQVKFSLIHCDHGRVAGRTGLGAVMGAKNLKAVAVRGTHPIQVASPDGFGEVRQRSNRTLRADTVTGLLKELGSAGGADYFDYLGEMPKRYFQQGTFEGAYNISGASVAESILAGVSTCHACVIACGRVVRLNNGPKRKGPEYETLVGFGPNLLIDDPEVITLLGEQCDKLGLDTISMSNTVGFAFSLFDEGVITKEDTGGLALLWGDHQVVADLIELTAARKGFGNILAEGARFLGQKFDREDDAVQVNGLEVAFHDPRGASGMTLVYATSPRGACHNQSDYHMVDIGQVEETLGIKYISRHAGAEKSENVARHQNWRTVCNSLVLCFFANVSPRSVVELVNASNGLNLDLEGLMRVGERGWNLKRVINNRLGLRRENDKLPRGLLKAYADGGAAGYVPDLDGMLEAYYQVRGWDPITGFPKADRLSQLGMAWAARDLWTKIQ